MSLAFHEPNKIKDVKSDAETKEQAEKLGLETEVWWDD
jgi:hypothetical protein